MFLVVIQKFSFLDISFIRHVRAIVSNGLLIRILVISHYNTATVHKFHVMQVTQPKIRLLKEYWLHNDNSIFNSLFQNNYYF